MSGEGEPVWGEGQCEENRKARLEELLSAIRKDEERAEEWSEEEMERVRERCHEAANLIMVMGWRRQLGVAGPAAVSTAGGYFCRRGGDWPLV